MVIQRYTKFELDGLADRCWARGTSRMLASQPELAADLRAAAGALRAALAQGWPVTSVEVEVGIAWGAMRPQ